jgi:hypothetical protein
VRSVLVVRCPYCAEAQNFMPMIRHVDGRFICCCGHVECPHDSDFSCTCGRCSELFRFTRRSSHLSAIAHGQTSRN